jgi:hypothetical protein
MGKVRKFVDAAHDVKRALGRAKERMKRYLHMAGRSDLAKDLEEEFDEIEREEIEISSHRKKTKKEIEAEKNGEL